MTRNHPTSQDLMTLAGVALMGLGLEGTASLWSCCACNIARALLAQLPSAVMACLHASQAHHFALRIVEGVLACSGWVWPVLLKLAAAA